MPKLHLEILPASQKRCWWQLAASTTEWLAAWSEYTVRDQDTHTLHIETAGVQLSFISGYKYPVVENHVIADNVSLASIMDIALMKLLAITHRATLRDYLDMAVILRDHLPLSAIIAQSQAKYGATFNPLLALRALVSFADLSPEMPIVLDTSLAASWQQILQKAVKDSALS